jgi:hypothetical protein
MTIPDINTTTAKVAAKWRKGLTDSDCALMCQLIYQIKLHQIHHPDFRVPALRRVLRKVERACSGAIVPETS